MDMPTKKDLLEKIKAGKVVQATIPVPAGKGLAVGDRLPFVEATFDQFGIPTHVAGGDSSSVVLKKTLDTGRVHGSSRLFEVEW
jgi:hypothetical protein